MKRSLKKIAAFFGRGGAIVESLCSGVRRMLYDERVTTHYIVLDPPIEELYTSPKS